jgi:ABC-type glycerol-3-phosphate transport system permease component
MARLKTGRMLGRSRWGNFIMFSLLILCGAFMVLPIVYSVLQSFKPLNEINLFPPRFFVTRPTLSNYGKLFQLSANLWVPFSRYVFNSVFVSVLVTFLNVLIASMCAYPLAKYTFPGSKLIFRTIVVALLFSPQVTYIPQYVLLSRLKMINTYWAMILPPLASTLGLYLMRQYMIAIPDSLLEAGKLDGAGEHRIFWQIVMPNVKPAWLTLAIFQFQQMWSNTGSMFLRSEELKPLQYSLQQITTGGISRAGAGAAVTFIIAAVPIVFFLVCQSSILETMTTSGMKE